MCTCASCEYTDSFAQKGFAEWPKGKPAGPRRSAADYNAHVAHLWEGVVRRVVRFTPGLAPRFPSSGGAPSDPGADRKYPSACRPDSSEDWTTADYVDAFMAANNYAKAQPVPPARGTDHFPAPDRKRRETAVIYDMEKEKEKHEEKQEAKRARGRPTTGKPFLVRLEPEQMKRAEELGEGNISAGIRKALAQS